MVILDPGYLNWPAIFKAIRSFLFDDDVGACATYFDISVSTYCGWEAGETHPDTKSVTDFSERLEILIHSYTHSEKLPKLESAAAFLYAVDLVETHSRHFR